MKIRKLAITNFRRFSNTVEIDFTDVFDQPQDLILIAGPNSSGKTTILDAIAMALESASGWNCTRDDLPVSPRYVVRSGKPRATVSMELQFSQAELDATNELITLAGKSWEHPTDTNLEITWEYPDPLGEFPRGRCQYSPANGRALLQGRKLALELSKTKVVPIERCREVGATFTFDQQRSSIKRRISKALQEVIRPEMPDGGSDETKAAQEILLQMAIKAGGVRRPDAGESHFEEVRRRFHQLCRPKRILDYVADDNSEDVDVPFTDGRSEFNYFGLSSGEQMILSYLLGFVDRRIARSVVLIDELELHLHPIWQQSVLYALRQIGDDNQLIVTTHSPHLRDIAPTGSVYLLGDLDANPTEPTSQEVVHA